MYVNCFSPGLSPKVPKDMYVTGQDVLGQQEDSQYPRHAAHGSRKAVPALVKFFMGGRGKVEEGRTRWREGRRVALRVGWPGEGGGPPLYSPL